MLRHLALAASATVLVFTPAGAARADEGAPAPAEIAEAIAQADMTAAVVFTPAGAASANDVAPSLEQIAEARAEADAIAKADQAEDLFENVTDSNLPALRHKASGVVCTFEPKAAYNQVHVYYQAGDAIPRGDDVSCQTQSLEIVHTLYMTRYDPAVTVDAVLAGSDQAIRSRFKDAKPYKGQSVSIEVGGKPAPWKTLRFEVTHEGRRKLSRSSAMKLGPWMIAHRLTAPIEEALAADMMAEMDLGAVIDDGAAGEATKP